MFVFFYLILFLREDNILFLRGEELLLLSLIFVSLWSVSFDDEIRWLAKLVVISRTPFVSSLVIR